VNSKHKKTLEAIWAEPVNGNLEWARLEALLLGLGCQRIEGAGSSVTFDLQGRRASFHRPHPGKEALRYRVKAVRDYLKQLEIAP
jgi:HicA toxin of bacterial toxin-antitoxin,